MYPTVSAGYANKESPKKMGRRPGRIYHVMRAAADVTFNLLTSGFVLSPSLFFP